MKVSVLFTIFLLVQRAEAQDTLVNRFIGKWAVCYSIGSMDVKCNEPIKFYTFKNEGKYQEKGNVYQKTEVSILGTWTFLQDTLELVSVHKYMQWETRYIRKIGSPKFINRDLFYTKVNDTTENPGHWFYCTYRRLE